MKLLDKSALYNFLLSIAIIALGAICFYVALEKFIDDDVNEKLAIQKERIERGLARIDSISIESRVLNKDIVYTKLVADENYPQTQVDTSIFEPFDREFVPYRVLSFTAHTRSEGYRVQIYQSLIESDDITHRISRIALIIFGIYISLLVVLNRLISRRLWRPFYTILEQLKGFDLKSEKPLVTTDTSTDEFAVLNTSVQQMMDKVQLDYRNLKEFTENASHETQTPLAIIRSKVELLLQADDVSEYQWQQLTSINDAVSKLSRLNKALLLLAKIDNNQFGEMQNINLSARVRDYITELEDLIALKELVIHPDIEEGVVTRMNPYLLDVLLENILMNAIRHNIMHGFISIHVKRGLLEVYNSGEALTVDPQTLFERFRKGTVQNDSVGIGLSLVHRIAVGAGMKIQYTYSNKVHSIRLAF
ncbi:MAG: HAMP domain-containing histidine kinase [Bacteroidetes bacterium]|nr:HAMP domain-containing histidine kinase [Bacteroidota bacterium]